MNKVEKSSKEEIAVSVSNLSKTFKIPHEKESTMKGTVISLLNSSAKGYEIFKALDGISFEVKKGEFFGIIGRNGCGKSTLLKTLAGIYVPDKGKGTVDINGKLSPFLELGVGFNPELTGRENIFLGGTILGLTRKQIAERYDKIVNFSELEEFIDMKLKNYSSGMQVRLAFSLAINVEAEILLMDEVLAVGDTNFQNKCLAEFNKYREKGKTVILVTHDIAVVQRYCDKAMLLRNGKIIRIGDADEVCSEYLNQNMEDEEKRIMEEEKAGSGETSGVKNKKIEINTIELFDGKGTQKNNFKTGENIKVRVYFKQHKPIEKINFGLALMNQEHDFLFGIATDIDKIDVSKYLNQGFFEVVYKDLPLRNNRYYFNVVINSGVGGVKYDYIEKAKYFQVFSSDRNTGAVNINYDWS